MKEKYICPASIAFSLVLENMCAGSIGGVNLDVVDPENQDDIEVLSRDNGWSDTQIFDEW